MPRRHPARRGDQLLFALALCLALLIGRPVAVAEEAAGRQLQLEVSINGEPTKLIAPFTEVEGQGLVTARSELEELYIKAPGAGAATDLVRLKSIPGLKYEVDERAQAINLIAEDKARLSRNYDASASYAKPSAGTADYGLVANYNVYSSTTQNLRALSEPAFNGTNVSLDSRFITPYGVLNQTAILGPNLVAASDTLRLETYAVRVDPDALETTRLGDAVTGGLAWTRPIRLAGAQLQHNYVFRPDLVTSSLPSYSGSAAVPSTVDVYINNVKSVSQQVGAGPYQLTNLPVYAGGSDARVVVRDASGKETQTSLSFFASPRLLREGVYESSAEIGAPRLRYGILSDDYEGQVVGSGTLRLGMLDWLTAEAHGETGLGINNGGIGLVARAGGLGVINAAVSGSAGAGRTGAQLYGAFDTKAGLVSLHASSQRALAGYVDLAGATARLRPSITSYSSGIVGLYGSKFGVQPIRSLDNIGLSVPIEFDRSTISTSFLHAKTEDGQSSRIATISYSRPLFDDASLYATAFRDFGDSKGTGLFLGVSMPLGKTALGANTSGSFGVTSSAQGRGVSADVSKSLDSAAGSWGWRIRDVEGTLPSREASVSHRASMARLDASVQQLGEGLTGRFQADGAIIAMGGNVYLSNRIDDSFAVVSAGAPGLKVLHENRAIGETDEDGMLLVPNLRSHHANKITIDTANLPIDAEVDRTSQRATPAFRSGVYVDFAVKTEVQAAIVILKGTDGAFIPAGSEVKLAGDEGPHVVGYDGQVYLNKLAKDNSVSVKIATGGTCNAAFAYALARGQQTVIGPVTCQ